MAPNFKSLLISLAMALSAVQVACARPQAPPGGAAGFGTDPGTTSSVAFDRYTHVPVAPVHIAAETDFLPINNVLPIVNVLPTDVNDFSGWGPFDRPLLGGFGDLGFGMGGAGLNDGIPGAGLGGDLGFGMGADLSDIQGVGPGFPGAAGLGMMPGMGLGATPGAGLGSGLGLDIGAMLNVGPGDALLGGGGGLGPMDPFAGAFGAAPGGGMLAGGAPPMAPTSSSSSSGCNASMRVRWKPDREESSDDASSKYRNLFKSNGRPRAALPHPAENTAVEKQEQPGSVNPVVSQNHIEQNDNEKENVQEKSQDQNNINGSNESTNDSPQSPPSTPVNNPSSGNDGINNSVDSVEDVEEGEDEQEQEQVIAQPFEATLGDEDDVKYLTYLPYAGITNQFYGMLRGMEVAKALGRTLIIPPITASSHDKSKQNQPWSKFLNLAKFSELTGTKVVEFHQLMDVEQAQLGEIKCGITCGFGSKRTIDFTAKGFLKQWKLDVKLEPLPQDTTKLETITSLLLPRSEEKYLCISNTYKIAVQDKSEWERFGQHLYFTEELESFVKEFLDQNLVIPEPVIDPETNQGVVPEHKYLAIHVRRGDFATYCEGNFKGPKLIHCLPTTEQIAERIDQVQTKLNPSMDPTKVVPVFVATNENRPEELKKFAELGWRYLDHSQMGTAEKLGVFGPMMVDQVFMAHAQGFVGIQMSTFSRVGALRQRDWHHRQAEYM
ncbi:hypothetical protein BGZ65_005058 [Modicella reniformis]|uniref:GDP-fucose protein O-fucosyltransferase 2 n=1 Tax=Modicella reniformis TaxID=1440133 RepID=A0A9P6IKG1_9FUNG|nr:hypothetical protein BGZ65_005058 [Modicella reniformis]